MKSALRVIAFWAALLSLLVLTVSSFFAVRAREEACEMLRMGHEDVARRVQRATENLKLVQKFSAAALSGKTTAFTQMMAERLADIEEIRRSARIGHAGHLSIRPIGNLPPPHEGLREGIDGEGQHVISFESNCAGYRIFSTMPDTYHLLGKQWVLRSLATLLALWCVGSLALFSKFRRLCMEDAHAIRTLFAHSRGGSFVRLLNSPVTLACVVAFVFAIAVCWGVSARTARNKAEDMLRVAAKDMRGTFDSCVDLLLFYQGTAICQHYKSPENMSTEAVQELMQRYGLDELNVVNAEGRVVIGALADVGYDMGSRPKTAEFNCLLRGTKTFSQPFRGAVEDPTIRRKYAGIAFPPPAKGYIQLGFAEERVKDGIDYWFADQAVDLHIGESGFCIIAKDETGVIDSCGLTDAQGKPLCAEGATLAEIGFDVMRAPRDSDTVFEARLFGIDCLCLTEVRAYHRIISAIPLSEVTSGSKRIVLVTSLVLLAVLALVATFMNRLSELVKRLQGYIAAETERQLKDLTLAKTIQTSSLPVAFPDERDYKIFAKMVTAREVGGDFYDFYTLPDGRIIVLIADVSGKGIPAALFMMRAKALIRAAVYERHGSLVEAVAIANDNLADHNDAEMFVTAWIAIYDRATGAIEYVNAGHNPPIIRRANGAVEWVRGRGGLVLAAMGGMRYRANTCHLAPGDSILLYTDGVTEAMSKRHEQYGEARLAATLSRSTARFVTDIDADVSAFTKGAEQSDDITMLALDRL